MPALQPKAGKVINYIRNATWVSVNLAGDITKDGMGTNLAYTEEEKKLYREDPAAFREYRKYIERSCVLPSPPIYYPLILASLPHS